MRERLGTPRSATTRPSFAEERVRRGGEEEVGGGGKGAGQDQS